MLRPPKGRLPLEDGFSHAGQLQPSAKTVLGCTSVKQQSQSGASICDQGWAQLIEEHHQH